MGKKGDGGQGLEGEEIPKWGFDTTIFSCSTLFFLSGTDAFLFCEPGIPHFAHRNTMIAINFTLSV